MPILRHECTICGTEKSDLYGPRESAPYCCDRKMRLLMPTRVVGRVVPDSDGVHAGSGFASASSDEPWDRKAELKKRYGFTAEGQAVEVERPQTRYVAPEVDPDDPQAVPLPSQTGVFGKDYEQCSADERDERWHDSAQALASWTVKQLEAKGEDPTAARDQATDVAQQTITKARSEATRADGLT